IIVLSWLFTILKYMNPLNWGGVFLAYDNILDIRNHKDQSCKESYNPASLKKELPDGNTMAAEQTFVWLSHFKKILCAM
ncbi:unnamed protein product, partial [Porites lobata]